MNTPTPPHAIESEMALLGAALADPQSTLAVGLESADFYVHKHRWIWDGIRALYDSGQSVDFISIADAIERAGHLQEIGGTSYLAELLTRPPNIYHAATYADIVRREATRRRLLDAASAMAKLALTDDRDIREILAEAEARLKAVSANDKGSVYTQGQAVGEWHSAICNYAGTGEITGLTTGWPRLDKKTNGLGRGRFGILAGRPSMGKTSLAAQSSVMQARAGLRVGVFTMEIPKRAWVEAFALAELGIDKTKMKESDIERVTEKCNDVHALPIVYYEKARPTLPEIDRAVLDMERELGGLDILWFDHLGYIDHLAGHRSLSPVYAIGQTTKHLVGIAKEYNCNVTALCQMSRESARTGSEPHLTDLRDSGELEQDARYVWFIHRPDYYADTPAPLDKMQTAHIIVRKNDEGPTGKFSMAFIPATRRFAEMV